MKLSKILVFCLAFMLMDFAAVAQKTIAGKILDSENDEEIPHVYVENATRKIIAESDKTGYFEIFVHPGDTLVFSSIGYFWAKYVITDESYLIFRLNKQVYDIGLVTKLFPYSYDELSNRVLHMKPTEDSLNLNLEHDPFLPVNTKTPGMLTYTINGAITELYNATNRHARIATKAAELLNHKEHILVMNRKFNKKMVMELTTIPEKYFDDFIAFCDFSDEFLINTSEFQIIMTICFKYDLFADLHPELKNVIN